MKAVQPPKSLTGGPEPRIQEAETSIEDLSKMFTKMLLKEPEHTAQHSIEGLAYASLQPTVKDELSRNKDFLNILVKTLANAQPKSPLTYGALSIIVNLTRFEPTQSDEEKKMSQLKAYANAMGKLQSNPLNDDQHVSERCQRVFEAGVTPVLVTHSKNGSVASLSLTISIVYSLSVVHKLRGQLAQQGAIRLLIAAWNALPASESATKRRAAQALARILITTNPEHVFGGTRPIPQNSAIRPLASIITPDPDAETRDLLPTFEALMALTNLASTDDDTRQSIVRGSWGEIEEQLLSSNARVTTAAVELVCNLVQCPDAVAMFADGSTKAKNRLHILLALADAEDAKTRSGAGGALASLAGFEPVVKAILTLERGVKVILGLCFDDDEGIRHRGAFVVLNMVSADGETGRLAREKIRAEGGVEKLTECAKKSRSPDVVGVTVQGLTALLEQV
jgi:hypothetical protein